MIARFLLVIFLKDLPMYIVERNYLAKPKYYSSVNGTDPALLINKIAYILVFIVGFMLNVEVPWVPRISTS
jgi:hypothetical protein